MFGNTLKIIPFLFIVVYAAEDLFECFGCHPDCFTCTGPSYKDCDTCKSGDTPNKQICCSSRCQECNSDRSCKTCKSAFVPFNGLCLTKSPNEGEYEDYDDFTMKKCMPNCKICYSSNTCDQCEQGYFFSSGSCQLKVCNSNQYIDGNGDCKNCPENCTKCISDTQCNECNIGFRVENGVCNIICDLSCLTCGGSQKTECLTCSPNFVLIKINEQNQTGICSPCPENCKKCKDNRECEQCTTSVYEVVNGMCIPVNLNNYSIECSGCSANCLSCYNDSSCYECESGYELDIVQGLCKKSNSCPKTTYYNQAEQLCKSCSKGCAECTGPSPSECTACLNLMTGMNECNPPSCNSDDSVFIPGSAECASQCPNNKYLDIYTRVCEQCEQGYYFKDGKCNKCSNNCASCSSDKTCFMCIDQQQSNQCQLNCPEGMYLNSNQQCAYCDAKCQSCTVSSSNCTSCRGENREAVGSQCVCKIGFNDVESGIQLKDCVQKTCSTGYYDSVSKSCSGTCTSECQACTSSNQYACQTCKNPSYFLWRGNCLEVCPYGTKPLVVQDKQKTCIIEGTVSPGSCPDNTYNDGIKCAPCITSCQKCSDAISCTTCQSGYKIANNICVACPGNNCSMVCDGINRDPSNNCACLPGYNDTFKGHQQMKDCYNVKDQQDCPKQYKDTNGNCKSCETTCDECYGGGNNNCLSCVSGKLLDNGSCVDKCPEGKFQNNTDCIECKQDPSKCCKSNEYYDPIAKKCLQCSLKCLSCSNNNSCITCALNRTEPNCDCKQGMYSDSSEQCQNCLENCSSCIDGTSCNSCKGENRDFSKNCVCKTGYTDISSGVKVEKCSQIPTNCKTNEYYDLGYKACKPCHLSCLTCSGPQINQCSTCPINKLLENGSCLDSCAKGKYKDEKQNCIECQYKPSECQCQANQYYDQNGLTCQQCPSKCESCLNNNSCTVCAQNRISTNCECKPGMYNDNQNQCQNCLESCSSCVDGNTCQECKGDNRDPSKQCSCKTDYQDTINGVKIEKCILIPPNTNCIPGEYYDQGEGKCKSCHSSCLTCYGPQMNSCTTCQPNLFYYLGTCLEKCLDNTIQQQNTCVECKTDDCMKCNPGQYKGADKKCYPCKAECGTCNDGSSCQTCLDGTQQSDCSTCKVGTYKNSQGQCIICEAKCQECQNSASQCTKCNGSNRDDNLNCSCKPGYSDIIDGVNSIDCVIINQTCEKGKYYESNTCKICNATCFSCYGPTSTNCTSCVSGGQCLSECPVQSYYDEAAAVCKDCIKPEDCQKSNCKSDEFYDLTNRICQRCPVKCSGCSNSNTCLSCAPGRIGDQCDKCEIGFYLDNNGICSKCDSKCSACTASSTKCTVCKGLNRQNTDCSCISGFTDIIDSQKLEDCIKTPDSSNKCKQGEYLDGTVCSLCHQSCKSCFGPSVAQCTSCTTNMFFYNGGCYMKCPDKTELDPAKNTCVECTSGDCLKQCQNGQYYDYTKLSCSPCQKQCATCESEQICSTCSNGYTGPNCSLCEAGKYADSQGVCRNCDPKCLECSKNSTNCSSCQGLFRITGSNNNCECQSNYTDILSSGVKVKDCFPISNANCLEGQYLSNTVCKNCHSSCNACYGPLENQCKSCPQEYFMYYGRCILECPIPLIKNEILKTCTECVDPSKCPQKCNTGQYYDLFSRGCFTCPKGCISCESADTCTQCEDNRSGSKCQNVKDGMFINPKGEVELCNKKCGTCVNANSCTSCRGEFRDQTTCDCLKDYTDIVNGQIVVNCIRQNSTNKCPSGQFISQNRCNKCHSTCQNCTGPTSRDCSTCQKDFFLINGECLSQCPEGMKKDTTTNQCIQCQRNECINCSSEQFYDLTTKKCLSCEKKCKTCLGTSDSCIVCSELRKGTNCEECIDGYYKDELGVCNPCDIKCDTCSGSSSNCTSCKSPTRNQTTCECLSNLVDYTDTANFKDCFAQPSQTNNCSSNQYFDGSQCIKCSESCNTCFGKLSNNCLTCSSNLFLLDGTCVKSCSEVPNYIQESSTSNVCRKSTENEKQTEKTCGDGYFYNKELRNCYRCDSKCSTCSITSSSCKTCAENRIQSNDCSQCKEGLFKNSIGECVPCDNKCSSCSSTSSQCLKCQGKNRLTTTDNCQCISGYVDLVKNTKLVDCIKLDEYVQPKPVIVFEKQTEKIANNHFKIQGQITFNTDVNILSYNEWKILLDQIDPSKMKVKINYTDTEQKLSEVKKQVFTFEIEVFADIKNDNLPKMQFIVPNNFEVQDVIQQELIPDAIQANIPPYKTQNDKVIKIKDEDDDNSNKFELIAPIQALILLALSIPSQFNAFVLSLDIFQLINQSQFLNIKFKPILENCLIASDFSNFRFLSIFNTNDSDVPRKFQKNDVDSTFLYNIIQPIGIWIFSFILYLISKMISSTKSNNRIIRMVEQYKNCYFYFIICGVALMTLTKSVESTLLQLRDTSNLDEPIMIISYALSLCSILYYFGYIYLCHKATSIKTIDIIDNPIYRQRYTFFSTGLKHTNKASIVYLAIVVRKILYSLSAIYFFDDPIKQVGFCNFIIGLETLLIFNIKPFYRPIEQKIHIYSRILLILMHSFMYIIAFEEYANFIGEDAKNIVSFLTVTSVILNYFIQIIYSCFVSFKKLKSKLLI